MNYKLDPLSSELLSHFQGLNNLGKIEAIKRVEELTEIKKYTEDIKNYTEFVSDKTPEYWEGLKSTLQVIAAHNDHAEESEELEKMQEDIKG